MHKDPKVQEERQALKDLLVREERMDWLVHRDLEGREDQKVQEDQLDQQDQQENVDNVESLVHVESLVRQDHRDH